MIIGFIILICMGFFVSKMVKTEPMIAGSGIPQVEGILSRNLKINWIKVLFYKFLGGVLVLGAGLSVGKEGPSVQIGASIGQGFGSLFKRINIERKFLITAGASAGLSSAFNAPLSGVLFALEEVHKNFSPVVLIAAMTASLSADFILRGVLDASLSLDFGVNLVAFPLQNYWMLILLGIVMGLSGAIFTNAIIYAQKIFVNFKIPIEFKIIFVFVLTGIIGIFIPSLLGGGHNLILNLPKLDYKISILLGILLIKFLFTIICFGSGVPGGIFFPLLVLGGIIGNIFGILMCRATGISNIFILNFIILAMAGNFASIVKAPITGMVLIMEMTGSFENMLALSVVVITSYVVSDIIKLEPIYEILLDKLLEKIGYKKGENISTNKTLIESVVESGCIIDGKLVKDIKLPNCSLLVSIKRGEKEIIPRGYTKILAGDYLVVMASESVETNIFELLEDICVTDEENNEIL
ncbi:MAG: ClC family H(+)/Cl(-) exchange transporter [Sarcina sp.]